MKKIYCVYFTNPARIDLLKMSLKSLDLLNHPSIMKVFVYLNHIRNEKEILKMEGAISSLKLKLDVKLVVRKYFNEYYGGRCGIKDFNPEMRVYLEINEEIWDDPDALICQLDTDILFISDKVFDEVMESDADLIGHACMNKDKVVFVQGSIYFLKSTIVPEIMNISFHKIIKKVCSVMAIPPDKCGEDTILTYCVKKVGKVQYSKIQLYGNAVKSITEKSLKKYSEEISVLHFHRCSTRLEMLKVSQLLSDINDEKMKEEKEQEKVEVKK